MIMRATGCCCPSGGFDPGHDAFKRQGRGAPSLSRIDAKELDDGSI